MISKFLLGEQFNNLKHYISKNKLFYLLKKFFKLNCKMKHSLSTQLILSFQITSALKK